MAAVLRDPVLTPGAKVTGIALSSHFNFQTGLLFPAVSTVAIEGNQTTRAATGHMCQLKLRGFVEWTGTRGRTSNRYKLLIPTGNDGSLLATATRNGDARLQITTKNDGAVLNTATQNTDALLENPTPNGSVSNPERQRPQHGTAVPTNLVNIEENLTGKSLLERLKSGVGDLRWKTVFGETQFHPPSTVIFARSFRRDQAVNLYGQLFQELGIDTEVAA
jgi:hypothetical protein